MLENLNPAQKKAVMHTRGPLLVIAGAGAGKTRVITCRIAKLINEEGIKPYNILALTFTNKASSEMKQRIESLLGQTSLDIWASTFHSACLRILRRDIKRLGYSSDFVVYDTSDQHSLVKNCLKDLNVNEENYSPKIIANKISLIKNKLLNPNQNRTSHENNDFEEVMKEIYPVYQKKLKANNALDFDDLLLITVKLLKSEPDLLSYYQNKFQHILVDEYQDTNHAQYQFIYLLAKEHQNICVVGDEDQSIYRWRGANINNILDFEKNFKNASVVKLEENYRSTKNILAASNYVIKKNTQRKEKTLYTSNQAGEKISYYKALSEVDEGNFICRTILDFQQNGKSNLRDFAVFYRTNAQSRIIEDSLRKSNISYQIIGGLKFYERKEIKDILAYCRLVINPDDSVSFNRIINTKNHGIGKVTLEKIVSFAGENSLTQYQAMEEIIKSEILTGAAKKKVENLHETFNKLKEFAKGNSVSDIIDYIQIKTGYFEKLMNENTFEARNRMENLKELITAAKNCELGNSITLSGFLDQTTLFSDIDGYDEQQGSVALMTLHNSKGLEFPIVFIAGMEDNIFPHSRSKSSDEELEEERRLFYVGMTRAKHQLFLLNAKTRKIYGAELQNSPSMFLLDIPDEFIKTISPNKQRPPSLDYKHFSHNHGSKNKFSIGKKVIHPSFGNGIILNKTGDADDEILQVFFKGAGKKMLKSKYANLKFL